MMEIKFACPHCRQHIACDANYVDMCIVCPTCGRPMVVPLLSTGEVSHPEICVVASAPAPKRRLSSRIPTLDMWRADEWEEHLQEKEMAAAPKVPHWVLGAFATTIIVGFLVAFSARTWIVMTFLVLGIGLCLYLLRKGGEAQTTSPVIQTIGWVLFLIIAIPAMLLGIVFIGCCAAIT
jgi:hypothetical protein